MFRLLLKFARRGFLKNKFVSGINLLGLTIAFACCLLVCIYVVNETSYDRWYSKHDRLFRVAAKIEMNGIDFSSAMAPPPLAKTLVREIPEVEKATRLWQWPNISVKNELDVDDILAFNEKHVVEADSNFFDVFQFKLIQGDTRTVLKNPRSIVLTRETAIKYFGLEDYGKGLVVGKSLALKIWGRYRPYEITGICESPKEQTHFSFDILFASSGDPDSNTNHWLNNTYYTYAMLSAGADPKLVEGKMGRLVEKYINGGYNKEFVTTANAGQDYWHFLLQPVTSIHLNSNFESELKPNSNMRNIFIAVGIALLVLIVAVLNFINLFTVGNLGRAKEIALRRISGAARKNIVWGFLFESLGIAFMGMILALVVSGIGYQNLEAISPGIKELALFRPLTFLFPIGLVIAVGLGGGLFSAIKLAIGNDISLMKNQAVFSSRATARQLVVTGQFVIAMILISVSILVSRQLHFLIQKDPGYDQEHVLVFDAPVWGLRQNFESFKSELLESPDIISVTTSSTVPGDGDYNTPLYLKKPGDPSNHMVIPYRGSYDFLPTIGLQLIAGRTFAKSYDDSHSIMLSESAVRSLGLKDPVGTFIYDSEIRANQEQLTRLDIIGVVKDIHFESYYKSIRPFAILFDQFHNYVSVQVKPGQIASTLNFIKEKWIGSYPDAPFSYSFLDKKFEAQYNREASLKTFILLFTGIAIFIAVLGLFAISMHIAGQRAKEIGIRKVNGAKVSEVMAMLNRDFVKWVLIAFVIATPMAYYAMSKWLENFAYKTNLSWWIFALAGLLALSIALLTVSWQSWRAATRNPVEALRYE
ncbi:ABC transporter permease [Mangrovibacterium lignilyticum]|uniref:ABC transporter permease n=1 Tax=Mangrovibacterium lignilyticum TaxID=2668052 RepID=UPI0013CFC1D4|nr:ABC transporter permease [Mangrovibacterium lignilyticum]